MFTVSLSRAASHTGTYVISRFIEINVILVHVLYLLLQLFFLGHGKPLKIKKKYSIKCCDISLAIIHTLTILFLLPWCKKT